MNRENARKSVSHSAIFMKESSLSFVSLYQPCSSSMASYALSSVPWQSSADFCAEDAGPRKPLGRSTYFTAHKLRGLYGSKD